MWYFRDVSDIIQFQVAQADSERRYRTAFQTTLDAIAVTTLANGVYLDVNQAFLDITGYARDELVGRSSLDLGIWADPDDRRRFSENCVPAMPGCSSRSALPQEERRDLLGHVLGIADGVQWRALPALDHPRHHPQQGRPGRAGAPPGPPGATGGCPHCRTVPCQGGRPRPPTWRRAPFWPT
ncbi:MAG: PAS domain S-box protein [Zoogloea sp.]|nr:PAS domain S-box protein [Zoogloea sp.]